MTKLEEFSDDDLSKELKRRKIEKKALNEIKPLPFDEERHNKFIMSIKSIADDIIKGRDKDSDQWLAEETLIYVYGKANYNRIYKEKE